jgi:hypothetical protein
LDTFLFPRELANTTYWHRTLHGWNHKQVMFLFVRPTFGFHSSRTTLPIDIIAIVKLVVGSRPSVATRVHASWDEWMDVFCSACRPNPKSISCTAGPLTVYLRQSERALQKSGGTTAKFDLGVALFNLKSNVIMTSTDVQGNQLILDYEVQTTNHTHRMTSGLTWTPWLQTGSVGCAAILTLPLTRMQPHSHCP